MQCSLYTQVTYTRVTETLSLIKESIQVMRAYRFEQIKRALPEAKFIPSEVSSFDLTPYEESLNLNNADSNSSNETVDLNLLYITLKSVCQEIRSHPCANHVQKRASFQDYLTEPPIFPIDLDMIQERLKSKYYKNSYTFTADVSRLLNLAGRAYANHKKDYSKDMSSFDSFVRRKMNEFGLEIGPAPTF